MKKNKIFIACDSKNISKIKKIISETQNSKIKVGYKFGLEFLNSKNGRNFVSKLKNKIIFADLKIHDIPNTCVSTIKAIKDLRINYLTIHISCGLKALKETKKISEVGINGSELPLIFLILSFVILLKGPGKYSLDHFLLGKKH